MKKKIKLLNMISMVMILLGLVSCVDHQERYDTPSWLGGSSIETLKEKGDYNIFLELMVKAGYEEPIQKQLFTLFVPSDEAFEAYFAEKGISSVDEMTEDEAFQLFTLHVLRNPRSRYQLIYEYVWDEEQGPDGEYAGLFLRKETPSTSATYSEYVEYDPEHKGKTLTIGTKNKFVPLWSKDYFEDYFGASDGSDYLFMYPNSQYDNSSVLADKAMNWHNAMVLPNPDNPEELEVRTASGFIFYLDQVVAPMPSLEEYLRDHQDSYGLFYSLMQRFAKYGILRINEKREVEYYKSYEQFPDLANDEGPGIGPEFIMKDMFTAFIPQDQILQQYLDENILNTYQFIDSVPEITLAYVIRSHINRSLGLISKMEKGIFNDFGDPLTIVKDDINSGFMCSNGVLYDMKKVLEPAAFNSVAGDLFFNKNYSTFLFAMNEVDLITTISSPAQHVTLFAPSNSQLEAAGIRYNSSELQIEYKAADQIWREMKLVDLTMFVRDHILFETLPSLEGEGFAEMSSGNYIHYKNNVLTGPENEYEGSTVSVEATYEKGDFGILHNINNVIKSRDYTLGKLVWMDTSISEFAMLLDTARLINRRLRDPITKEITPFMKFFSDAEKWTLFVPTNQAMREARAAGLVPLDKDGREKFLLYHFLRDKVIFDDGDPDGAGVFSSNLEAEEVPGGPKYVPLIIKNYDKALTIFDNSGQEVVVEHENANLLAQKSVVHKINTILKY